jgi:hypothetical protein
MLRHRRLNEVIAADNYFASVNSIEGYYCAQVFSGMNSGVKTESYFTEVYLDFIRKCIIQSARYVILQNLKLANVSVIKI